MSSARAASPNQPTTSPPNHPTTFHGRFFSGKGDVEYLQLLDIARRMWAADPEFQSIPMLFAGLERLRRGAHLGRVVDPE